MPSSTPPFWRRKKIKDIAEVVGGSTPDTKDPENYGGSIPWITVKDLSQHSKRYIFKGERNITEKGLKAIGNRLIPRGSLLISSRAPIGYLAIAGTDLTTNQGIRSLIFRPNCECDPEFVYYLIKQNIKVFESFASGSTFQEITGSTIEELEFIFPPYGEQRKIAEILGSLDDKIELNYEMNKTLDAIAQAIFKNWFVDFEPFKDELVYNEELDKEIPKGWEVVSYSAIVDYTFGFPFDSSYFNEKGVGFPIIRIRDLPYNKAEIHTTEKFDDIYVVKSGEILVSMDGEFKAYIWKGEEVLLNQRIVRITPKEAAIPRSYLYYSIMKPLSVIEASKVGTTVIHLNKEDLDEIRIILPKKDILGKFAKVSEPIIYLQVINVQENLILERIRDLLLPKLISGEIRVKIDVEKEFPGETKKLVEIGKEKVKIQQSLEKWFE